MQQGCGPEVAKSCCIQFCNCTLDVSHHLKCQIFEAVPVPKPFLIRGAGVRVDLIEVERVAATCPGVAAAAARVWPGPTGAARFVRRSRASDWVHELHGSSYVPL